MARTAASDARFVTARSEGGLLPPDLLARIAGSDPDLGGLRPEDYGLARGERLNEAIARAWTNVRTYWAAFRATSGSLGASESGVSETREQWLLPLFRELGYGRLAFRGAAEELDGKRYTISHQAGEESGGSAPPIHTLSFKQEIDRATVAGMGGGGTGNPGGLRVSPHGLVQDYLNRSDNHLWGIVTNGLRLRLLRDNASLSRAAFVEFDLEAMLEGGVYADFALLYLLLHRTRLPGPGATGAGCWLERWRLDAASRGTRALDALREGVEAAIRALGGGLLTHPENATLRARLSAGELTIADYYRQLLRLVYRLLFLLAAEERDLLFPDGTDVRRKAIYARHYGVGRLRELVSRRRGADRHDDLWRSLGITFAALAGAGAEALGLRPLGGGLFGADSCRDLDGARLGNEALLAAIRGLAFSRDPKTGLTRRVNYRDMDVEELGSVYEGLLELQPVLRTTGAWPTFELGVSGERKSTGSYYTNDGLVRELIASALEPVIDAALARGRTPGQRRLNLLALKVCDPACGSGHFLLAAARRIGREIARLDAGETEPDPAEVRHATREAIAACVYGVDRNPLAVDLCKLALWIEAQEGGKPLGFLDHHIKWGNSLVGATRLLMDDGIPDDVFDPVTGDDKKYASAVKKRNRQERAGQLPQQYAVTVIEDEATLRDYFAEINAPEETADDVAAKEEAYQSRRRARAFRRKRLVADLWTAAAFWPLRTGAPEPPTHGVWRRLAGDSKLTDYLVTGKADAYKGTPDYRTVRYARSLANEQTFFHWELEFEDVFGRTDPGFDCILGNPPWEKLKLQEQEFFAARDPEVGAATTPAARKRAIEALRQTNPILLAQFEMAKRNSEAEGVFLRRSGRYPLTARGDINTYSIFSELMTHSVCKNGRSALIVPTGIATDDTNKYFFNWLVESGRISTLYDFENRAGLFPDVDSRMKFSLLTIRGSDRQSEPFKVAFFLTNLDQIRENDRCFTLSAADIALFNPNSRTCPIFRTLRDVELAKKIYRRIPVLINEGETADNPWGVKLLTMFHMTSDSSLFRTKEQIAEGSDRPVEGANQSASSEWLPIFEGKMVGMYDHRAANIVLNSENLFRQQQPELTTVAEKSDPNFFTEPYLWAPEAAVHSRIPLGWERRWFPVFKRVTASTNERTVVGCVIPWTAVSYTLYLTICAEEHQDAVLCLAANLWSFVGDYLVRQKTSQPSLPLGVIYETAILPPNTYARPHLGIEGITVREWIVNCVLELSYTSWDLQPLARDYGYDGPPFIWNEERRAQVRADLDGVYAHLYGLSREDFAYILDSFPIVRQKDEKRWGEYRTKLLCLEAYDRFAGVAKTAHL